MQRFLRTVALAAAWIIMAAAVRGQETPAPADPRVASFDAFLKRVQRDPGAVPRDEMLKGMALGCELGRPNAAAAAARLHLNQAQAPSPDLVLATADAAAMAGDFRTAAGRYKQYLGVAQPSPANAAVAARLYAILLDSLNSPEEAFRSMDECSDRFRQDLAARRFDGWFCEQARGQRNFRALARRLALILSEGLPLELERFLCWHHIDALMNEVSYSRPEAFETLPHLRQIVDRLRDNPARRARYAFLVANLAFRAEAIGKDAEGVRRVFEPVVGAARAYFDAAPSADTFDDILRVWMGGPGQWNADWFNRTPAACRATLAYAFERVDDKGRETMINRYGPHGWLVPAEDWRALGVRFPEPFRRAWATAQINVPWQTNEMAAVKAVSSYVQGVPSAGAAIANALAAGGDDYAACLQHLAANSAWFLDAAQLRDVAQQIWSVLQSYPRPDDRKLPPDAYDRGQARWVREFVLKTPAAMHRDVARDSLLQLWRFPDEQAPADRSRFTPWLHAFDWVPYGADDRKHVLGAALSEFQNWANSVRQSDAAAQAAIEAANKELAQARAEREATGNPQQQDTRLQEATRKVETATKTAQTAAAEAARIGPIEEGFKQAQAVTADPAKGPTPLCQALARASIAVEARNVAEYLAAARAAYPHVRDPEGQRAPLSAWTLRWLTANRLDRFDTLDFQVEALADQCALFGQTGRLRGARDVMTALCSGRQGWGGWCNARGQDRDALRKVNDVFARSLLDQIGRGRVEPEVLQWFRHTRTFEGGRVEHGWNPEVYEQLILRRTLAGQPEIRFDTRSATLSAIWLVRNECNGLETRYPTASWFDGAYADEIRATKCVENRFWDYSPDTEKKGVAAAMDVLGGFPRYPFGDDGSSPACTRDNYWSVCWRIQERAAPEARAAFHARLAATFGQTRFDDYASGVHAIGGFAADKPEERKAWFERVAAYLDRVAPLPWRATPPPAGALNAIPQEQADRLSPDEVAVLLRVFRAPPQNWPGGWGYEHAALLLQNALLARRNYADLYAVLPACWKVYRDNRNGSYWEWMAGVAARLLDAGQEELAATHATVGLALLGNDVQENVRNTLLAVRSKALASMGGAIPVERGDRRYPAFAAQADYLSGKFETAWSQYWPQRELVRSILKEMDPGFLLWAIQRHTDVGEYAAAEELARDVLTWVSGSPQGFDRETRAALQLVRADIAKARQEFPRARAQYEQIALAKEFDDTASQREAHLRVAEVDRLTRQYDAAAERLEKLARRPDPVLQADAFYQLALVRFDQEDYAGARACIEKVFAVQPGHVNGRILEGQLHLRMKKLIEATEVRVGFAGSQETLVPGRPLKVQIEDRTLAVVGQSAAIEVRAWAASGDEEVFNLLPFGDSKTKFEGQVATALGAPARGDRTLQVCGGDVVRYDFSDRFRQAHRIAAGEPVTIRVLCDGELFVSSGRILSREEQEHLALEQLVRERLRLQGRERETRTLSAVRNAGEIKPGNPIQVRVIDPDRSTTPQRDRVAVRVATGSGDRIDRFELEETEGFSGVFEGRVPTQSAPATAFASDSEEGRDPVNAIAGGEHPAWVGQPDNRRPKTFSIDLNRMVELGRMEIVSGVAGRHPLRLLVQVSPSGSDFRTVGSWPQEMPALDARPWIELARFADQNRLPASLAECRDYLDAGYATGNGRKLEGPAASFRTNFNDRVNGLAETLGLAADGVNAWYAGRVSASFFLGRRQTCTFRVEPFGRMGRIGYWLALDGLPPEPRPGRPPSPSEITRALGRGTHRVDLFFAAHRQAGPVFDLVCDVERAPEFHPCSAALFSPTNASELAAVRRVPARIVATNDGDRLIVDFLRGTQARAVRLFLADFEGQAPAIGRISLTGAAGETLLPPQADVLGLKRNAVLEIVPGDRITVSYEDPAPATKNRAVRECHLTATFRNAAIAACTIESTLTAENVRQPVYIPLRRFSVGEALAVFIEDPDRDTTDQPDRIAFRVSCAGRTTPAIEAIETEPHSGAFVGRIFPVTGPPLRPAEIQVGPQDDLSLVYFDEENTDPGIPWERTAVIEQAAAAAPELRVYAAVSRALTSNELANLPRDARPSTLRDEIVPVTRTIAALRPVDARPDNVVTSLLVAPLLIEVTAPAAARNAESEVVLFVQTGSGRSRAGGAIEEPFDIRVPGTLRLSVCPGNFPGVRPPPGYRDVAVHGNPYAAEAMEEGRFCFVLPMKLLELPEGSPAVDLEQRAAEARAEGSYRPRGARWDSALEEPELAVRGDDTVYVGLPFTREDGSKSWAVRSVRLTADPFLHAMDRRYQETPEALHVGEEMFLRVIDPRVDVTDGKDVVQVLVRAVGGAARAFPLTETFAHSGVFKGAVTLVFAGDSERSKAAMALPVAYGDTVQATYTNASETLAVRVAVLRGADGALLPFTKRFKDPEIAVQTQFTTAEAYFEMAKKHRELGQREVARKEIAQGRRLLEEALRDAPQSEARAHADYLLAELAVQFADETADAAQKNRSYLEAVTRFTDIVASYPDSAYAPKSQFKKALAFEKMGSIDQACEEYVKLSYRYPDNELVAETIARLGQYFLTKNRELTEQARGLNDAVARETVMTRARDVARTAAQVFGRLHVRFPDHALAWKTVVLSGQCYLRAEDHEKAIEAFLLVVEEKRAEGDLRAQAMYWCGDAYVKFNQLEKAYRMFKNLTWNYPESVWAKYARGRLSEEAMAQIEAREAEGR